MVPKYLYSDAYPEPEDVDQAWVTDLLDHIDKKYNKMTPKQRDEEWKIFHSPMGELTVEQYYARQLLCQNKLRQGPVPISNNSIKDKALVHFNQIPWMQKHVTKWLDEKDPANTKSVASQRSFFVDEAGIYYQNQAELKDLGIVNNVKEKVDENELTKTRAEIADI